MFPDHAPNQPEYIYKEKEKQWTELSLTLAAVIKVQLNLLSKATTIIVKKKKMFTVEMFHISRCHFQPIEIFSVEWQGSGFYDASQADRPLFFYIYIYIKVWTLCLCIQVKITLHHNYHHSFVQQTQRRANDTLWQQKHEFAMLCITRKTIRSINAGA